MIKINLAHKKQSVGLVSRDTSATLSKFHVGKLGSFEFDLDSVRSLFSDKVMAKAVLSLVGAVVGWLGVMAFEDMELRSVDAQVAAAVAEKDELQVKVDGLKSLEDIKKSLESDEQLLKTKINAIRRLMAERGNATRMLVALAHSIPKEVWLSDFTVKDNNISLQGSSLKFEVISDFMKSLAENDLFTDLNLKNTHMAKDSSGMEVPVFELNLKRKQ